jgi:hypothetical protein
MLNRCAPDDETTPHDVGTLWALHDGRKRARCALIARADDWDVCVVSDGQTVRSARCPRGGEAFAIAVEWKRRMLEQGWKQSGSTSGRSLVQWSGPR